MSGSNSDGPKLKRVKLEKDINTNKNSAFELTVDVGATTSHKPTHVFNNDTAQPKINVLEKKLLEYEKIAQTLTEELHKQKAKSIEDQTVFLKTLTDLQILNTSKQHDLSSTISTVQRELQDEKLRTSKQTQSITYLTIQSNCATNRADFLQSKLSDIESELNLSKTRFEKEKQDLGVELKDKDNQITELKMHLEAVSSLNSQLQQESDRLKANILLTESQLEQALQENQSLRYKYEPPVFELSDSDTEGDATEHGIPLLPVTYLFRENVGMVGPNCDRSVTLCSFHPVLPVLAWTGHIKNVGFLTATCGSIPFSKWVDSKVVYECSEKITALAWNVNGSQLAAGCINGSFIVWTYPTGEIRFQIRGHSSRLIEIEWNPFDPETIATRDKDQSQVVLWDSSTNARNQLFLPLQLIRVCSVKWIAKNVISVGRYFIGSIQIYEIEQNLSSVRVIKEFIHDKPICALHLWNGTFLASCSMDKSIKIWTMDKTKPAVSYSQLNSYCICITWKSCDHISGKSFKTLIVVGGLVDGSIIIWKPFEKNQIETLFNKYSQPVTSISFSPDGKFLASSDITDKVIVWLTETWMPIFIGTELNICKRRTLRYQFSWLLVGKTTEGGSAYKLAHETWDEKIHLIENV